MFVFGVVDFDLVYLFIFKTLLLLRTSCPFAMGMGALQEPRGWAGRVTANVTLGGLETLHDL